MQITFEMKNEVLIIKLFGELDHHSSDYAREKIDSKIAENNLKKVIIDAEYLNFMDSSGIGVIIGRYKQIATIGGKLVIANLNPQIKRIYNVCGLGKIIPNYKTNEIAIEKL